MFSVTVARSGFPILLMLFLVQFAFGDFDLYRVDETHLKKPPPRRYTDHNEPRSMQYRTDSANNTILNWSGTHWSAVPHDPNKNCYDFLNEGNWRVDKSDVSGNKLGIRCKGDGCDADHDTNTVQLVEMHFSNKPLFHWTIYRDKKDPESGYWNMFGIDGNIYGTCEPEGKTGVDFFCHDRPIEYGGKLTLYVHRKFRCRSSWTVKEINEAV